jgi:two-component system, NtrC family, nitrogen regulation response regulator GlnG
MENAEVWIIDDDQSIRWVLERALSKAGLSVKAFASPAQARTALQSTSPAVVVTDIRMPGETGMEFLASLRTAGVTAPVIVMTAYSDLDSAVAAFQGGAFEYLAKPFDVDAATALVRRALAQGAMVQSSKVNSAAPEPGELLGQAPAMQDLFRAIGRLSQSSATVLITGESGSGKELVAAALHRHSPRRDQAFIALNTAAIPRDLLESELFGHERGAFTGAAALRRGRFEQADGGTLFLDEIGDMPADLQTRLLRVLSDGQFYRVGGQQPIRANVRVIAATHQDLEARVSAGLFREDLFHRLNVIRLRVPSLREREADIALLTSHFMNKSAASLGLEPKRISAAALQVLEAFNWSGNVRQLQNVCHWLNVMAAGQVIDVADLPPEIIAQPSNPRGNSQGGSIDSVSLVLPPTPMANDVAVVPATNGAAAAWSTPAQLGDGHDDFFVQSQRWCEPLRAHVALLLAAQPSAIEQVTESELLAKLANQFESTLIKAALAHTRGRRIEASLRLGIGRNTITRKIQELGLDS